MELPLTTMIRISKALTVMALIFLIPAVFNSHMSYAYYLNLRWVMFLTFLLLGFLRHSDTPILALAVIGAVSFNPLVPFHLSRDVWRIFDLIALVGLVWTLVRTKVTPTA